MAAPKKPKSAGVQKGKTKATAVKTPAATVAASAMESNVPAAATRAPGATVSAAANGNGNGAPTAEIIRVRAYEIFMARGGYPGDELSDWLAAEREIVETHSSDS
jgi:Protein of unknown function (DUF2934)